MAAFLASSAACAAGASSASVAQDSPSDAVERASSWCVLPVSQDSASLSAFSGTGDAARGVDSRDTTAL